MSSAEPHFVIIRLTLRSQLNLVIMSSGPATIPSLEDEHEMLMTQLSIVNQKFEIRHKEQAIDSKEGEVTKLLQTVGNLNVEIGTLRKDVAELKKAIPARTVLAEGWE